jgi:hypothetical protein
VAEPPLGSVQILGHKLLRAGVGGRERLAEHVRHPRESLLHLGLLRLLDLPPGAGQQPRQSRRSRQTAICYLETKTSPLTILKIE